MENNFEIVKKLPKKKVAISIDVELDKKIKDTGVKRSEFLCTLAEKYFERLEKKAS